MTAFIKDLTTADQGWRKLHIPDVVDLADKPGFVVIDKEEPGWKRPPAAFVLDLSKGSHAVDPEPTIRALSRSTSRRVKGVFKARLKDQMIYGSHHFYPFIDPNLHIQFSGIRDARFRLDYHVRRQVLSDLLKVPRIRGGDGSYEINFDTCQQSDVREVDYPVFFGSPIEPANWGMWLLHGIPSALEFLRSGCEKLLCFSDLPFQKSLLEFLGVPQSKLLNQAQWVTYGCRDVELLQSSSEMSFALPKSTRCLYTLLGDRIAETEDLNCSEKIFVSRASVTKTKGGAYRPLLNEQSLSESLQDLGFVVIEPERLTILQQIKTFRNARVVVGLGGAGMFNTTFCRPGTKIVTLEASTAFVDNHASLFASLGHEYGVILGERDASDPAAEHYRWTVDKAAAVAAIEAFA